VCTRGSHISAQAFAEVETLLEEAEEAIEEVEAAEADAAEAFVEAVQPSLLSFWLKKSKPNLGVCWSHKNGTKKFSLNFLFMFKVKSSKSSTNIQGVDLY